MKARDLYQAKEILTNNKVVRLTNKIDFKTFYNVIVIKRVLFVCMDREIDRLNRIDAEQNTNENIFNLV